jgi:hypothetical protein
MNEIKDLLFDDSSSNDDSLLSVFTDNFNSVYFQVKSDSGCEVTRLDRDKLLELKRAIDAHLGVGGQFKPLGLNSTEIELQGKPHPCIPSYPLHHKFKVCDISGIQIWCFDSGRQECEITYRKAGEADEHFYTEAQPEEVLKQIYG